MEKARAQLSLIWLVTIIAIFVLPVIIMSVVNNFVPGVSVWWSALIVILMLAFTFRSAATTVEENHEALLEVFGSYAETWTSGLHFIYPYFGLMAVKGNVTFFKGEDFLALFSDDLNNQVDFKDATATVAARVNFKVVDSYKAAYGIKFVFESLEEKVESALRAHLGGLDLAEANTEKAKLDLQILDGVERDYIFQNWGIKVISLVVSDIVISELDIMERRKLLAAETDFKKKEFDAKGIVTMAEANKKLLELTGEGEGAQVQYLVKTVGVDKTGALNYLASLRKYEAAEKNGNTLIIDGGDGSVSTGAKFGTGFNFKKKN